MVTKSLLAAGRDYNPGDRFDKTSVTTRRLRQLFDAKYLHQQPPRPPEPPEVAPPAPDSLPEGRAELQQIYADVAGQPPNKRWTAKTLQAKIEALTDGESS